MTEQKMFSILLAWDERDPEQGTYSWAGLARDYDHAVEQARVQAVYDNEVWEEDSGEPMDDYMPSEIVLDSMEGVNMWTALELLHALKAITAQAMQTGAYDDAMNGEDPPFLEAVRNANAIIARAENGA